MVPYNQYETTDAPCSRTKIRHNICGFNSFRNPTRGEIMAGNIKLEIVTPEKSVVNEEVRIVVAPGSEGEFGVLIGHIPFLTTLKTGRLRFVDAAGQEHLVFISGGFAEALPDKVTVLAESAERRREIDVQRAQAARERA